jgi:spore coat polysaccharide biosynthesis protein SpsF (cytidylyltransferase family)
MSIEDKELLEAVQAEVEGMDEEAIEAEALKILAAQAKRKQYSTAKTPEQLEKQKAYRVKKYAMEKAILAKAKELGLKLTA